MQFKTSKRGILTDVSKLAERKDAIYEAVRLLNLAGEMVCENPCFSLKLIDDVRSMNLKEVEYICDSLAEFADEILEKIGHSGPGASLN